MNWTNKNPRKAGALVSITIAVLLLFILEAFSSIAFYQKKRPLTSSTVTAVRLVYDKLKFKFLSGVENSKFDEVVNARKTGVNAFPAYFFEPQFHQPNGYYYLSNVPNSFIINCTEAGYFNNWVSDEIGFRNPKGQIDTSLNYAFIGDSYTEGACEQESDTFAGAFRTSGKSVGNLGRGGAGPLFQLATLVEYGAHIDAKELVWFVFTGNDMANLREEKTTLLSSYLKPGFKQNLFDQRQEVGQELAQFIDETIARNTQRKAKNIKFPNTSTYGESLDFAEAKEVESKILIQVAQRIRDEATEQGKKLRIVILNHPHYDHAIQEVTSQTIKTFSSSNNIPFLEFSREFLSKNWREFYTTTGPHFNAHGYRTIGKEVLEWVSDL